MRDAASGARCASSCEQPTLRHAAGSYCDGATRAAVHRERDQHRSGSSASPTAAPLRQGRHQRLRRARRRADAVNPARTRHQGRRALHARPSRRGRDRRRCGCASTETPPATAAPFGDDFDAHRSPSAHRARPTSSTTTVIARRSSPTTRATSCGRRSRGMLWTKQFYHYVVKRLARRRSRRSRRRPSDAQAGRNHEWTHLYNADVISMPDKWEYPWYAAWDLAFHCVPLALVDPDFAKEQLIADAARVVHAPERAAAGVRVGVRRRQPAGARLGRVARLQDREEAARRRRPRSSSSASSTSCCSTSRGG